MLRAAAAARLGDGAAAIADLRAAAHAAPFSAAVNRALLAQPDPAFRRAAARRILQGGDPTLKPLAYQALAALGQSEAGSVNFDGGRVTGEVAWRGKRPLTLRLRTDRSDDIVMVEPGSAPAPPGFDSIGRIDLAAPVADALRIESETGVALEPGTLLLPAPPQAPEPRFDREDGVVVIVPVYDDKDATEACLDSMFAAVSGLDAVRIVVVDDVTPDPELAALLDRRAAEGRIELIRNRINLGFAGSVNRALRERSPGSDVLLLNADTVLPPGSVEKLTRHLAADPAIATVTPLSNNGEDTSLPRRFMVNPLPSMDEIALLDRIAGEVNRGLAIDMPNGVGFCLLIRGDVLDRLGGLSTNFGRGYYEDVELCLRAAALGYRNVCATDCYVGHHGSLSFTGDKRALVAANLPRLAQLFPDYKSTSRTFEAADPLLPAIARIEARRLEVAPPFDILLLPEGFPSTLEPMLAQAACSDDRRLLTLRTAATGETIEIGLRAADGGIPQTLAWTASGETAVEVLAGHLACLPVHRVIRVDGGPPPFVLAAVARAGLVDGLEGLRLDAEMMLPQPTLPGPVVVLATGCDAEDARSIDADAARRGAETIIVADDPHDAIWSGTRAFVTGPLAWWDLPDWLTRVKPSTVLIGTARWRDMTSASQSRLTATG
jgi:GT2 family glycosyltransferase